MDNNNRDSRDKKSIVDIIAESKVDPDYCEQPEFHDWHFCKLARKGHVGEIAVRSKEPTVKCTKCNAEANENRDVCKPRPLD